MAFSYLHIDHGYLRNKAWELCSFTQSSSADTGGAVTFRYLKRVDIALIQEKSAGTVAAGAVVNGTFPLASNAVTIVTQGSSDGYIFAIGDAE